GDPVAAGLRGPRGPGDEVEGHVEGDLVAHGSPLFCGEAVGAQALVVLTFASAEVRSATRSWSRSWTIAAISSRSSAVGKGAAGRSNVARAPSQVSGSVWKPW